MEGNLPSFPIFRHIFQFDNFLSKIQIIRSIGVIRNENAQSLNQFLRPYVSYANQGNFLKEVSWNIPADFQPVPSEDVHKQTNNVHPYMQFYFIEKKMKNLL